MRPHQTVLIVDPELAEPIAAELGARFGDVSFISARDFASAEPYLGEATALLTVGSHQRGTELTAELLGRMPKLEWVQGFMSGWEHMAAPLASRPDVALSTATGVHGPPVAEHALTLMLMLARNAPEAFRRQQRRVWEAVPQRLLEQKTVGIVGLGAIGTYLARLCKALSMNVIGISRTDRGVEGVDRIVGRDCLVEVAPELDFLVITVPAADDTNKLVSRDVLAAMKTSALLVNVARGIVIDEGALVEALREGKIAGAGIDAFMEEPLPTDSELWGMDNVIVTPHSAGLSDRFLPNLIERILETNVARYLERNFRGLLNLIETR